jgi:hypothetical protein
MMRRSSDAGFSPNMEASEVNKPISGLKDW